MKPYFYVRQATENGESLLSLCCGDGREFKGLKTTEVTAVDIFPDYLVRVSELYPHVKVVESDATDYIKKAPTNSVDIISLIDAIEHLTKKNGLTVLKESKRVARKQVLVFTPEGFIKNEPHDAWGIYGGDKYQKHISGWEIPELEALDYKLIAKQADVSQHGDPYNALMFRCICSQ